MAEIRNKIDLHLHIDGSVRPQTVYELSRLEGFEPECYMSLEEITKSMVIQPGTFDPDFLTFDPPIRAMQSAYGLERITYELIEDLAMEGLCYAELRFAPQYHLQKGLSQREVVEAVLKGYQRGRKDFSGLECGIILCCMDVGEARMNYAANVETVELAKAYYGQGVCAIDLAGYESDLLNFADLFAMAKDYGIPATCHSEFTVEEADQFSTSRIGHGYQYALDPKYTKLCLSRNVTLEMCPVSSVKYDYGLSIDETHPLRKLFLAGAKVTVNTDNRTVLQTSLGQEYDCMRKMGFTDEEIEQVNENAIRCAFTSEQIKEKLLKRTQS